MPERQLRWDGCVNVRDLGGLPTEDGGETRFGRVVRADSVRGLSDAGWAALAAYGVRRIVDLRADDELAEDAPRELPLAVVHVPLLDREALGDERLDDTPDPIERRRRRYLALLASRHRRFAEAVSAIARAPEGAVVVHCAGGVDRTGLVSALVLRLAGVGREDVAGDYAESEANWAPFLPAWLEEARDDEEREYRRYLALIRPEVMLGVLEELEQREASVREYLLAAGVAAADLDRVRARLRR